MGYKKCAREWSLGFSSHCAEWALGWIERVLQAGDVEISDLRGALGRLVFVYGALAYERPFLGPVFAFLARHPNGGTKRLPLFVNIVLMWLRDRLKARRAFKAQTRRTLNRSVLRVDAKADGLVGRSRWVGTTRRGRRHD